MSLAWHQAATGALSHALMRPLILCVDDESDITTLIRFHLLTLGCDVIAAASGREALQRIAETKPDLVLLDLMLPDIDGFGVCEILRRSPATATLPIVILSAWTTADAKAIGFELGVLAYLTKPFSPKELVDRVRRFLAPRLADA
ncbi:MAG: response regulator [Opitutaceae bacterium]|nr:response regulator [Opitutaceae bacterium]